MKKADFIKAIKEVLGEKKRPGLWANINAKQKREDNLITFGFDLDYIQEVVDHLESNYREGQDYELHVGRGDTHPNAVTIKNPQLHKDADLNDMLNAAQGDEDSYDDEQGLNVGDLISFKADPKAIWKILGIQGDTYRINQQGERSISYKPQSWLHNMIAKGKATVVEGDAMKKEGEGNEKELAGIEMELPSSTVSKINAKVKDPSTMAQAILHYINSDLGNDKPSNETANPQDGKAAPHGSGYKSITKEDIHNIVATEIKRPSKQGLKRKLRKALTGK